MTPEQMINRAKQVFDIEIAGLEKTRDSVGDSFVQAVEMILDCASRGGILVVSGVGKNLHIAEKMSAIFSSTGTRSIVLNPVQAMHGDLGMVSAKDILLALSFSGESAEVNNLIPAIRRHGLKVISMTGRARRRARSGWRRPTPPPPRWRWATRSRWCSSTRRSSRSRTTR